MTTIAFVAPITRMLAGIATTQSIKKGRTLTTFLKQMFTPATYNPDPGRGNAITVSVLPLNLIHFIIMFSWWPLSHFGDDHFRRHLMNVNIPAILLWVYVYLLLAKNTSVWAVWWYTSTATAGPAMDVHAGLYSCVWNLLCLVYYLLWTYCDPWGWSWFVWNLCLTRWISCLFLLLYNLHRLELYPLKSKIYMLCLLPFYYSSYLLTHGGYLLEYSHQLYVQKCPQLPFQHFCLQLFPKRMNLLIVENQFVILLNRHHRRRWSFREQEKLFQHLKCVSLLFKQKLIEQIMHHFSISLGSEWDSLWIYNIFCRRTFG